MPLLTRLFLKTAFLYLILSFLLGIMLAGSSLDSFPQSLRNLFPVYLHLLVVGWITQLIIGVGYWMFPKATREQPRGSEPLAWATYFLLNAGLVMRALSEPFTNTAVQSVWGWLLILSAFLQWAGGTAFVVNTWNRIKEK